MIQSLKINTREIVDESRQKKYMKKRRKKNQEKKITNDHP